MHSPVRLCFEDSLDDATLASARRCQVRSSTTVSQAILVPSPGLHLRHHPADELSPDLLEETLRPRLGRDDEADPGEQFAEVVLDLGDHSPGQAPGRGLIREAPVADQRGMARSSGAIDNARIAGVR